MAEPIETAALLDEQRLYYRERAPEYDDWWERRGRYDRGPEFKVVWDREVAEVVAALDDFAPTGNVLEFAGGTGNWSRQLARHADHLTVVDQSTASLERNEAKLAAAGLVDHVEYVPTDIFGFEPAETYDVVFFSFWLSHVPADRFEEFWRTVDRCLKPGGRVFLLDNVHPEVRGDDIAERHQDSIDLENGTASRSLADGRAFRIVKRYWRPSAFEALLADLGWDLTARETTSFFLWASGGRTRT